MILKSKDAVCPKPGYARKQLLLTTLSRSQKGNCRADTSLDDVNAKDINGDGKLNEEEMFGNPGDNGSQEASTTKTEDAMSATWTP